MPNEKPVAAATSDSSSNSNNNAPYVRLHVSPLDAELLPVVLNSSLLPKARNVSFHTIETFPERRYGFVELPKEDADKVRKKFNGAVLRGAKMKVDPAKPDKNPKPLGEEVALEDGTKKPKKSKKSSRDSSEKKSSKKRKREEITGVVLEEGRQVKRGWTSADEPKKERKDKRDKKDKSKDKKEKKKDKKKERVRSKYTDHDECLVKTVLPPNKVANAEGVEGLTKKKKKDNKREVVVHEFAKTTKFPTFLKTATTSGNSKKAPPQFDEERKCWVDEDGNVVEEVKATRNPKTGVLLLDGEALPEDDDDDSSSSSEDEGETRIIKLYHESSSESEDDDDDDAEEKEKKEEDKKDEEDKDDDGSSMEYGEEKSSDEKKDAPKSAPEPEETKDDQSASDAPPAKKAKKASTPPPPSTEKVKATTSSPANKNLSIRIPPPPATPVITKTKTEVHPLEALYKKPKDGEAGAAGEAQPSTGFSFFGGNNDDIEEEDDQTETTTRTLLQVPLTPYTEKDFESRGLRSAAPTPDTAHPSRRFKPWEDDNQDDNQEEEDEDADMMDGVAAGASETEAGAEATTSDFQKWFWEHRGDLNRSWKKRRKLVGKEKRYRENRARMAKAI